jgi:uncharacterized membrane protein YfcA
MPQPGYGVQNPFDSRGTTAMVVGIAGLVVGFFTCGFGFLISPIALFLGSKVKKEATAGGFPEPGNAKAGRILGIIGTVLFVLGVVFWILVAVGAANSPTQ